MKPRKWSDAFVRSVHAEYIGPMFAGRGRRVQVAYTFLGFVWVLVAGCAHVPPDHRDTIEFPLTLTPRPGSVYACALVGAEFTCVPMQEFMDALEEARRTNKVEEL